MVSFFTLVGCTEEEEEILRAKVETLPIEFVGDSIFLNGDLLNLGASKAENLGFVIGREPYPDLKKFESIVLYNNPISAGFFSIRVLNDFVKNEEYYVRAFYRNSNETVYGDQEIFSNEVKEVVVLKIEDIMPKEGVEGDFVKIFGSGFGTNKEEIKILFGKAEAEIESLTEERIIVKIPPYKYAGFCKVALERKGRSVISKDPFKLEGPYIQGFTPEKGLGEVKVTIKGSGFSEVPWKNVVMIGEVQAEVFEASKSRILVSIKTHLLPKGKHPVTVSSNGIKTVSENSFEVVNPWTEVESIPTGLQVSAAFSIGKKIFLCTGNTNEQRKDAVFEYDTETNQWFRKASFPGGERVKAVGFSIGKKGYLSTGSTTLHSGEKKSDLWEYDPVSDQWIQKAGLPGGARDNAVAFSYSGKGYVGLGTIPDLWIKRQDFWQYDPKEDQWQRMPDFEGNGRIEALSVVLGNKFYVIGGYDPNTSFDSDIWEFNLDTHRWTFIGALDISPIASFSYENRCFLIIHTKQDELQLVEFDPAKNEVINELAVFPGIKRFSGSFSIGVNGELYFGGGNSLTDNEFVLDDDFLFDVWKYSLNTY